MTPSLGVGKVNQHTVSEFLLRQFTAPVGDQILWQFEKGGTKPRRKSPKVTTVESHFYSVLKDDGTWDNSIEDGLMKIENKAAPPLKRLMDGEQLTRQEREIVSYFIGLMFLRVRGVLDDAVDEHQKVASADGTIRFVESQRDIIRTYSSLPLIDARGCWETLE